MYFLNGLMVLMFVSCAERDWYKKELTDEIREQYAPQVREGRVYYYQGTVPEQFQLKEAMTLDSTDADLWREFGTARVKRGILDEMYYFYGEAVKRKPEKWAGFRGYLYLYFYRDYDRAIADFNLGDEANGQVDFSQGQNHDYMRGICYYGKKEYTTALNYLDKYINEVVASEGEGWVDVYAFLYRGLSLAQLGEFDEADKEFDRVLKYYPNLSDCFYHKARILAGAKKYPEALEMLSRAEEYFNMGYYHQRPYIEVLDQLYLQDIEKLRENIETIKVVRS